MNNQYAETLVKAKPNMKSILCMAGLVVACVLSVLLIFVFGFVIAPVTALIILGTVYFFPRFNKVEYEYVYCDGQLDFDRITGGTKRKTVLRLDMDNIQVVARQGASCLDGYSNNLETRDFSSGSQDKLFVILADYKDKQLRILFEPNDKMLDAMYYKSPSKVKKNG